jgi:broad specificity polyphosphatase/5'/3'-nucleotidase SurE
VGFELLVKALHKEGYPVAVLAPSGNHSATGMRINLMKPMAYRSRDDLVKRWGLDPHTTPVHLFELDGTPCDTMIVALDGGINHLVPGVHPQMVVSGVNLGPNLSQDSYHSGTMGAAREAGLYGVPAIASSFTSFDPDGMERAVDATLEAVAKAATVLPIKAANLGRPQGALDAGYFTSWPVPATDDRWLEDPERALLQAFSNGDMMLNINAPPSWDGAWATTRLGVRWYRNAVRFGDEGVDATATFTIGAASVDHSVVAAGDCDAVEEDKASLSCLAVWPQSHPFAMDEDLLAHALQETTDGWPRWLVKA